VKKLRPAQSAVLKAFQDHGPDSDAAIAKQLGMSGNTFRPRRRELADLGLLEKVGTVSTPGGRQAAVWGAVPPERIAAAKAAAVARKPRRKSIQDQPLDWKLETVRQLLADDEVNSAIRDNHGKAWSRARGRARQTHDRDRRELKEQMAQAERDGSAFLDFLKAKSNLLRAMEMIRAIDRVAGDELERRDNFRHLSIPEEHWPEISDLLSEIDDAVQATLAHIREIFGDMGPDVIDVEAIEMDDDFIELTERAGGAPPAE
jgi:DNA-binding Lrp family transcriptional regulator